MHGRCNSKSHHYGMLSRKTHTIFLRSRFPECRSCKKKFPYALSNPTAIIESSGSGEHPCRLTAAGAGFFWNLKSQAQSFSGLRELDLRFQLFTLRWQAAEL